MAIEVEKKKEDEFKEFILTDQEKRMTIFQFGSCADLFFNFEDYSIPADLLCTNTIKKALKNSEQFF